MTHSADPLSLPPPFVVIEGIDNVRTIGTFARSPSVNIKPALIYRGGDPMKITERGKNQLRELGITTVIDLRSDRDPDLVLGIKDVQWVSVPQEEKSAEDPLKTTEKLRGYETDPLQAFVAAYTGVLKGAGPVFELFFAHLRDKPTEPVLVQCSAGKNRTGIAIALLLMILGVNDEDIIDDYALSSIGLQAALPMLVAKFQNRSQAYRENHKGLMNFLSAKAETMRATLAVVREQFGGAENYLTTHTSLGITDIENIRRNLLTS
ncbi:hypothetical protein SERLADRAFT_439600 [Serpula lacrymans var. lacrymans S7.9]|uniref:Tyrosine specific protein phosphatases domain-containing protein n=1 Tax=Serpula lacrymans var. lacrymans (strain S7.9) TaxID=578457 RepID=F8P0Z9_SERL9|nr:uncharacterized protein SERLADRAFT_439600 [Serpula lacrymans var. lacrymans S7.9]EGO22832.1 hypothetical protein SERLADRAFT_439600 [Serpula lacrymans var. lacrymans S7.9]